MKPIFLKVQECDGENVLVPMKNQKHEVLGTEKPIKSDIQVIPKGSLIELLQGEVWATDRLSYKKSNWYVAGQVLYKITNEMSLYVTDTENSTHRDWVAIGKNFLQGLPLQNPKGTFEKKAPRPKPSFMDKLRQSKNLKPPTIEDDGWYVDTEIWYFLMRAVKKQKNTLLIGASGSGKTELLRMLVPKLQKRIDIFDMAVSNPNKTFCGNLRAENGSTYYQLSRFAKSIQEAGVTVMDELSRATPTANNIFLPLLDGRRTLYIEDAINPNEAEIKAHEDRLFFATANIGSEFVGTATLDHALLNRFQPVTIHYPPKKKESLLLQKRFELSSLTADSLVGIATTIRQKDDLSKDVSTRQLFEVAELIQDGYTTSKAFEYTILEQFEGNLIDGGEKQIVKSIIQGK